MNLPPIGETPRAVRANWAVPAVVLAALAGGTILAGHSAGVDVLRLTRDPSAVHYGRPSDGAISLLGVICWAACAGGLVVTALARRAVGDRERSRAFVAHAAFALMLCLDDALLIHETAGRTTEAMRVGILAIYGLVAVKWLAVAKPWRDRAAFPAVVVSLGLLASSALLDLADDLTGQSSDGFGNVVDDALKVAGIAAFVVWTAGSIWTALSAPVTTPATGAESPRNAHDTSRASS